jgi:hypothetical protein
MTPEQLKSIEQDLDELLCLHDWTPFLPKIVALSSLLGTYGHNKVKAELDAREKYDNN